MRHSLSPAFVLLILALTLGLKTERHAQITHAAPLMCATYRTSTAAGFQERTVSAVATQTARANSKAGSSSREAPVVREIDLEAFKKLLPRGAGKEGRPLLVNFWATWCEPCREEFPDLVRINSDYEKRNLDFITISLDDPAEIKTKVPEFLREMRAPMPAYLLNVVEPQSVIDAIDPEWGGGLPATFLFDASGQIVFKKTGRVNAQDLRAALDKVTSGK